MLDCTLKIISPEQQATTETFSQTLEKSHWRGAQNLHGLWQSKYHNGFLPKRRDFHLSEMTSLLGMMMITEIQDDQDHLYARLIGTGLCQLLGRNLTNQNISEQSEIVHLIPYLRQTIETKTPAFEDVIPLYVDNKADLYCKLYSCPILSNDGKKTLSLTILKTFQVPVTQP